MYCGLPACSRLQPEASSSQLQRAAGGGAGGGAERAAGNSSGRSEGGVQSRPPSPAQGFLRRMAASWRGHPICPRILPLSSMPSYWPPRSLTPSPCSSNSKDWLHWAAGRGARGAPGRPCGPTSFQNHPCRLPLRPSPPPWSRVRPRWNVGTPMRTWSSGQVGPPLPAAPWSLSCWCAELCCSLFSSPPSRGGNGRGT